MAYPEIFVPISGVISHLNHEIFIFFFLINYTDATDNLVLKIIKVNSKFGKKMQEFATEKLFVVYIVIEDLQKVFNYGRIVIFLKPYQQRTIHFYR